jgi:uncharacterized repeat protein (TIGR02543 family)
MKRILTLLLALLLVSSYAMSNEKASTDKKYASNENIDLSSIKQAESTQSQTRGNLIEGFEGTIFPPDGWRVINGGGANTWARFTTTPITGTASASILYNATAHNDWLITPPLVPVDGNNTISFWAKNHSASYIERFNVMLSTTGNDEVDFTVTLEANVGPGTAPTQYTYDLSAYNGQIVYVAIQAISADMWRLYVDDFSGPAIYVPPTDLVVTGLNKQYTQYPASQLSNAFYMSTRVRNIGQDLIDPVDVEVSIATSEDLELFATSDPITLPLANATQQDITASVAFDATTLSVGSYKMVHEAIYGLDNDPDNNIDQFNFAVTDYIYAKDNGIIVGGVGSNTAALTFGSLYNVLNPATFSGIYIKWPATLGADLNFNVALYEVDGTNNVISTVFTSGTVVRKQADQGTTVYYPFSPINITAGRYILAVKQLTATNLAMGYDGVPNGQLFLADVAATPTSFPTELTTFGHLSLRMELAPKKIITFNVDDGTNPLQGATVTFTQVGEVVTTATTDASGVAAIWALEGDYQYTITCVGYTPIEDVAYTITGDDVINVSMTVAPPALGVTPTTYNFGTIINNELSAPALFTIQNIGSGTLTVNPEDIVIIGDDADQFTLTTLAAQANLTLGQTATFSVVFAPNTLGTKNAQIRIEDNLGKGFHYVDITGISADPTIVSFPWVEPFEDATFPPFGWNRYNIDGGGSQWASSLAQNHTASGSRSALHAFSNVAMQDGWLVTPPIQIEDGKLYNLSFWSNNGFPTWYYKNSVLISTGSNLPSSGDFTEIWSPASVTNTWVQTSILLNDILDAKYDGVFYLAFRYEGDDAHNWYLDDVSIKEVFTLSLSVDPTDSGVVTGDGAYAEASIIALTATANPGFTFVNWTDTDENEVSDIANFNFTMPAENITLTANFVADAQIPYATAFEEESSWDNPGGAWTGYNEKTYSDASWFFHSTAAVRGVPTDAGELTYDGSPYTMRDRGIFTVSNIGAAYDMIGFSFQLRDWMTGDGVDRNINVSYDGGTTWDLAGTINKAYFDAYQVYQPFVFYFGEAKNFLPGELIIQIIGGTGANASRINIGQFRALDAEQAIISPVVATYDIYNNYDVEVDITWGSASSIASVEESGSPLEATEFAVDVDLLSISADYFVGMAAGTQVFFTVNFDNGDKAFLRVTITDLSPIVTWPTATDITFGDAFGESVLENGLAVDPADGVTEIEGTFAFVNPAAVAPSAGTWNVDVMFTPTAYQSNNPVYGTVDVIVNKALADITISDLDYVYDDTAKSATVTTDPAGLTVVVTYDGFATLPVSAGTYLVEVTIDETNYEGYASDNLVIEQAPLTITADSFSKTVGIELSFTGTEFTYTGTLYGDDDIASVTLTSDGAEAVAIVGDYDIVPSDAVGVGVENYDITYVNGTLTVTDKITLTLVGMIADNKVYDNTNAANISDFGTLTGVEVGDDVTLVTTSAVATFNNRHVGVGKLVTVAGLALDGLDADKYVINNQTTTANITARPLTLSAFTASNKVYDGTTAVTGTGFADDRIAGNVLTFTYTAAFEDKNAGVDKNVNYTAITISGGADMLNYALVSNEGVALATISQKELTVTDAVALDKTYDGSAVAEITGAVLAGVVELDDVVLENETEGTFPQAAAGTDLVVTTAMTISGVDAINYYLTQPALTATIHPKAITVLNAVALDKVYDGTTIAVIEGAELAAAEIVGEDDIMLANHTAGTFAQASIGTGIAVSTAMTLTGVDAGNYSLTQPVGLTADITAKALTVTGAVAQNKVYDGTTVAVITGATLSGAIVGDDVALANHTAGTFAQAGIGTGIAVSTAMTITGTHAGNYTLTQPAGLTADITAKGLTIGGTFTVADKTYDGTTAATITNNSLTLVGVVGAETVTLANVVAAFANAGPGNNIAVNITGADITGAAAANYTLSLAGAPTTTANIFAVTYSLTLEVTPADAGTVTGEGDYEEGEEVTVVATANTGFVFVNWIDEDEAEVSTEATYTFDMPGADLTLTAVFAVEPGITDPSSLNISLYPNPSRGAFTITSDEVISEISVYNLIGKVVYTGSADSRIAELSISGVEPGMYFVKITTEKGTSTIKLQINK